MKKKHVAAAAILLIALLGLYRGVDQVVRSKEATATGNRNTSSSAATDRNNEITGLPTKVSDRPANSGVHATHRPDQLKQFYLPEVIIDGLPLKAALTKLQTAYEDVCRGSGEVPVRLTFVVPPEATHPLTVKTGIRNLDGAIHLLAAMSGLKVSRTGSEYAFTAPKETGEIVKKSFKLPPDFFSVPSSEKDDPFSAPVVVPETISPADLFAGNSIKDDDISWENAKETARLSPTEYFASKGITLDPDTKLTRNPDGTLQLETTSAADRTAIEGLIGLAANDVPLQHKIETRMIQLSAGMDWTPPDTSQLDGAALTQLMRQLDQSKGVDIVVQPSITARTGQDAKIEIIREVIFPPRTPDQGYRIDNAGVVVDLRPVPYGFGHHVDLNFSEKVIVADGPESDPFQIVERTAISDSSFSGDGNSSMHVQTHPDGSRSVVVVTPTLIDATGRPLHPK
jgi:hypothetical protein